MDEMAVNEMEYMDSLTDVCLYAITNNYNVPNLSDERFGEILGMYNDAIQGIVNSRITDSGLTREFMIGKNIEVDVLNLTVDGLLKDGFVGYSNMSDDEVREIYEEYYGFDY